MVLRTDESAPRTAPRRRRTGILVTAAIALSVCGVGVGAPAAVASTPDYTDASGTHTGSSDAVADNPDWMGALPDDLLLSELSIPGTHDSETSHSISGPIATTQTMAVAEQLTSGIRLLDIRAYLETQGTTDYGDDVLTLRHGEDPSDLKVDGRSMTARDTFISVCIFLAQNPTETVIVRFGDTGLETKDEDPDPSGSASEKNIRIDTAYKAALRAYITLVDTALDNITHNGGCFWHPQADSEGTYPSTVPTLGAVRGKLVLNVAGPGGGGLTSDARLNEFGIWSPTDDYAVAGENRYVGGDKLGIITTSTFDTYTAKLEKNIKAADSDTDVNHLYITNFAANTGEVPSIYAGGLEGSYGGQGLNELMVEWLLGLRTINSDGGLSVERTGMVMLDYPGASLIDTLIAYNYRLMPDVSSIQTLAQAVIPWWAGQVDNEPPASSQGDAAARFSGMRDILAHLLPNHRMRGWAVHDLSTAIPWPLLSAGKEASGLAFTVGDVGGYGYRFWSWERPGSFDQATVQKAVNDAACVPTPPMTAQEVVAFLGACAAKTDALRAVTLYQTLKALYPSQHVNVLAKGQPLGFDNWASSPTTARADFPSGDGYAFVAWITDAPLPPTADAGGPYTADEGGSITLDAGASSDPAGLDLTYCWQLSGEPACTPSSSPTRQITMPDDYSGTATLTGSNGATTGTATASVTFVNVAPAITGLTITPSVDENGLATLTGQLVDPGVLDSHDVTVEWGDGGPATTMHLDAGEPFPATTHRYLDDSPSVTPSDTETVTVTVTDKDRGSSSSSVGVMVNNVAPAVTNLSLTAPLIDENGVATLTGTLVDPGTLDTHDVYVDWGDGSGPTRQHLDAGAPFPTLTHRYLDDDPSGSPWDIDRVTVTVADDDNGSWTGHTTIRVDNVAPSIQELAISTRVDENGVAALAGDIVDPGTLDTHDLTIDWGDGSAPTTKHFDAGASHFVLTHRYLDDNPTGTPSDNYTATATVTDDDSGSWTGTTSIRVDNVAPVVSGLSLTPRFDENGIATLTGTLTDPGTLDTHDVVVNWGDGSDPTRQHLDAGAPFPTLTHRYLDDNPTGTPSDYAFVTVTVTDDDTGRWSDTRPLRIDNVAPVVAFGAVHDGAGHAIGPVPPNDVSVVLVGLDVTVDAVFTDVGTLDTHTSVIDWGDGTMTFAQGTSPVSGTHRYLTPGDKTITVAVADDDLGVGTASRTITVVDAAGAIQNAVGTLQAALTDGSTPPATTRLIQSALDTLIGNNGGAAANGALDQLGGAPTNSFFVKLEEAASLLDQAGLHTQSSLVALTAKSAIVTAIDQAASAATSLSAVRAITSARADVAAGDSANTAADAIEQYRLALVALRPAM